jgi:hypothetical protein
MSSQICIFNPIAKSLSNPRSLRLAITAKCYECFGGSVSDVQTKQGIMKEVRDCTSSTCPLYPVR